ncbi:hypothetical protein KJS94_01195 [Flavihumibacter rivuli]|uniref:bestrophin family protein n=1 Tax=Flavihumibacter rivuli TaxID=2838156 RepID=UPI001BDE2B06|nr:bestrophin family ion channel [Flavihumibacter rivuli]ULQ56811.1 hypothetical protein KJS94_01195 [Flavihumibacter rivuli]
MIIKRNFSPIRVWQYTRQPMSFILFWSIAVWALYQWTGSKTMALNFTPAGVMGSALAIFIAFRNNSAYSRWWEARTIWGSIINNSRILARQVISNTANAIATGKASEATVRGFQQELLYRQAAFAHALRLHLRQQDAWEELKALLPEEEYQELLTKQNKPNHLLLVQGNRIKEGMRLELLGPFDNISMEPTLGGFSNFQCSCERIKNTPLPRQYDFFTRVFVYVFALLLPFSLLGFFVQNNTDLSWLIIPLSLIIAGVFVIMERTGAANEDPFENKVTDIPLTALCNTIERDLKEMLGEALPAKTEPEKGYLF